MRVNAGKPEAENLMTSFWVTVSRCAAVPTMLKAMRCGRWLVTASVKGLGFYQTDYRSDSYKKAAEADKSSSEPAKPAAESKSTAADTSSPSKSEPAKPAPAPSSKTNHDPGTLPNLFQIVRGRLDRRPPILSVFAPNAAGWSTLPGGSMARMGSRLAVSQKQQDDRDESLTTTTTDALAYAHIVISAHAGRAARAH